MKLFAWLFGKKLSDTFIPDRTLSQQQNTVHTNASSKSTSHLLSHESVKIQTKALWLIGETGLVYPQSVKAAVPVIASFCDSQVSLLLERAVNAIGRIGRGDYHVIEQYWSRMLRRVGA